MGNKNEEIRLEDIVFMNKNRITRGDENDVYISLNKKTQPTKKGDKQLCVSFRDTVSEVYKNEKFLTFGAIGNRLYFMPSNSYEGYKVQKRDFTRVFYCMLTDYEAEIYEKFAKKTYHLRHDDDLHLYYVELHEKEY